MSESHSIYFPVPVIIRLGEVRLKEKKSITFDEFADELIAEIQPRALIILAASQVDFLLRGVLEKYFLPKSAKANDPDELLDGDVPLGAFSARIKMAKRTGLIDKEFYELLNQFKSIRNGAAHWRVFRVSDSPLKDSIRELQKKVETRTSYKLVVDKYFEPSKDGKLNGIESLKAVLLTICALTASVESAAEKFSVSKGKQIKLD